MILSRNMSGCLWMNMLMILPKMLMMACSSFWSHLVALQNIWSHLVAFSVHYLNTLGDYSNHLIDKSFNSHQEYTIATSLLAPARGTKKTRCEQRVFLCLRHLLYGGISPVPPSLRESSLPAPRYWECAFRPHRDRESLPD